MPPTHDIGTKLEAISHRSQILKIYAPSPHIQRQQAKQMRPIHALRWTLISQLYKGVTQLLQLILLARLLGPAEYGLVALATAFTSFALIFSDLGLTASYIQNQNISTTQRNALFTCNIALATIISIATLGLSPVVARVLGNDLIAPILRLTGPIILITAIGQQVRATAEKQLNFKPLAFNEIIANTAGFLTTITLAMTGTGAASIIWGAIVYATITSLLPWIQFPTSDKPKLTTILKIKKQHLSFGINTLASSMLTNLTLNLDLFLSSRFIDHAALGAYSLPRNLSLQIQAIANPPINRAAYPIFAKNQNNKAEIRTLFTSITSIAVALNAPIYLTLFFYAEDITSLVLGSKWNNSVDLLKIFAIWGIARTCLNPPGTLLLALNKTAALRNWNLFGLLATATAITLSAPAGTNAIAIALSSLSVLQIAILWATLIRTNIDLKFLAYLGHCIPAVALGAMIIGGIKFIWPFELTPIIQLITQITTSLALYAISAYLLLRNTLAQLATPTVNP